MPTTTVRDLPMYYEHGDAGAPLVLISPLGTDHLTWGLQVPDLTAAGFRCLTFDNRDVGQTGSSSGAVTMRDFADDTAGLMTALGISRAHIVGASFGGMIAQELALNHPDKVETLTLSCTLMHADEPMAGIQRAWKRMQANSTPAEFFRAISPWLFSYRFFLQPEPLATVLTLIAGNPFPQTAASFGRQADAIIGHDTRSRAGTIRVPTHVIVGTEDILTPPSHSRALAAAIPGATLTEVQGVGHAIHSEQPGAFTRAVIDFLRR